MDSVVPDGIWEPPASLIVVAKCAEVNWENLNNRRRRLPGGWTFSHRPGFRKLEREAPPKSIDILCGEFHSMTGLNIALKKSPMPRHWRW